MENRRSSLKGLLDLFLLTAACGWLERRFGFGRGCSCSGCGCGVVIFILFLILFCNIIAGTDWARLF
jgi:hypothetical protein